MYDNTETDNKKFKAMGNKIFYDSFKIKQEGGKRWFVVKINKLPPEYYPSVNVREYLNSVKARITVLEEDLQRLPEKKSSRKGLRN